ncbi:hypothetical protein ACFXA0_05410 [Streptomyces cyaneofuscatus]|uniref:hypothetical protein n=1 Tax=Streptomyces cyaneofuscatus TaxID=66883 RepID=UPI003687A613
MNSLVDAHGGPQKYGSFAAADRELGRSAEAVRERLLSDRNGAGYTALAAHTAVTWLVTYLDDHLGRTPGNTIDLHLHLNDLVAEIWTRGSAQAHEAAMRLHRSTRLRSSELRDLRALTAVRHRRIRPQRPRPTRP